MKKTIKAVSKFTFNLIFRLIASIPFALFILIASIKQYILCMAGFYMYGGEFVVYQITNEKNQIAAIYSLLQSDYKTNSGKIEILEKEVKITNDQLYDTMFVAQKQFSFIIKKGLQSEWNEFKNTPEDDHCEGK